MPNTAYQVGARFERRVKKYLESLDYYVMRSPGSKSPVDLVVLGSQTKWLVQCKVNGVCAPTAWNALYDEAEKAGAIPIIALRERRRIEWRAIVSKKDKRFKHQPWARIDVLPNKRGRFMSAAEYRTIEDWLQCGKVADNMSEVLPVEETQKGKMLVGES